MELVVGGGDGAGVVERLGECQTRRTPPVVVRSTRGAPRPEIRGAGPRSREPLAARGVLGDRERDRGLRPDHVGDVGTGDAATGSQSASESLQKLDRLIEQNSQLEKQNRELLEQVQSLRRVLAKQAGAEPESNEKEAGPTTGTTTAPDAQPGEAKATAVLTTEQPDKWGAYTPNLGYKVANTDRGDLSISIYSYARYLNQLGLDSTYTDAFGNVKNVQQRQDFQLQKVQIKFLGWMLDPKFRYFLYAWSSNASQGLGAQVVLAGNLNYASTSTSASGLGSGLCRGREVWRATFLSGWVWIPA